MIDEVQCRSVQWKLWDNPVTLGEERLQAPIGHIEPLLTGGGESGSLKIKCHHRKGGGTQSDFLADLAQADDADGCAVQGAHSREAAPIGPWSVTSIERAVGAFCAGKLINADQAVQRIDFPG